MLIFLNSCRPLRVLALALLTVTMISCTTQVEVVEFVAPVWPHPPDRPRFQYELTLRSEKSIYRQILKDQFRQALTSSDGSPRVTLIKPFDVAAGKGRIIVSDTVIRRVYIFDVPRREVLVFGAKGSGKLGKPLGVALDGTPNYYVVDASIQRVMVYDDTGHFLKFIGTNEDFDRPTDVAVTEDGQRIYVVDAGGIDSRNHRVIAFNAAGEKLFTIGERGKKFGQFNLPTHATVGPDGSLYVLDTGNFRVQVFDDTGKFLRSWGGVGKSFGQLARPRGIAVDLDGNVYVSDTKFGNFQIFNPKGQLLLAVGSFSPDLDKPGGFSLIAGVAVDETYRVYAVDQKFRKVEVFRRISEEDGEIMLQEFKEKARENLLKAKQGKPRADQKPQILP